MTKRITLSLLILFIFSYSANAVTFYWRSGLPANSLYTNVDNWESLPGSGIPANGAFAPSSIDDVIFPAGNNLQNIVIGTNAASRNFTVLASGRLTFSSGNIFIYGSLSSNSNHYFQLNGSISFNGAGNHTIDMGDGLTHVGNNTNIIFNGSGTYTLVNNHLISLSGITMNETNIVSGGFQINCSQLTINTGTVNKTINFENSKITANQFTINTSGNSFNFIDTEIVTNFIFFITGGPAKVIDRIKSITFQGVGNSQMFIANDLNLLTISVNELNINNNNLIFRAASPNAILNFNVNNLNFTQVADLTVVEKLNLNLNVNAINAPPICKGLSGISSSTSPLNLTTALPIVTNAIAFKNVNFSGSGLSMPTPNNLGQNTGNFTTTGTPISQTFYWVGGTGNWNDPTKWSIIGSGGAAQISTGCLPTSNNNVVFDDNSFTQSNQVVTIAGSGNTTGYTKNISWIATNKGSLIGGKLNISASANFTGSLGVNSDLYFVGDAGNYTITSGNNFTYASRSINFSGTSSSTYTINDNFKASDLSIIYINSGNFSSNGKKITTHRIRTSSFPTNSTNLRNIDISNSIIDLIGASQYGLIIASEYLNSFLATGSTINFTALNSSLLTEAPISSNTIIFNDINFTSNNGLNKIDNAGFKNFEANNITFNTDGIITNLNEINNTFTVNNYNFKPGKTYLFTPNSTTYIVNNAINTSLGSCSPLINLGSEINGTRVKLSKPTGTFTVNRALIKDINSVGVPLNISGTDGGNNLNVVITTSAGRNFYWVGGTGNWHNGSKWSIGSSGGNPALNNVDNCVPSILDNVFFDSNSFNSIGQVVTIDADASLNNMSWNVAAGAQSPVLSGATTIKLNVYGSISLASGMSSSFAGSVFMLGKSLVPNAQSITTNGVEINNNINLEGGGRYDILDNLTMLNQNLFFTNGQFFTNSNTIRSGSLKVLVTGTNIANISNSSIYLTGSTTAAPYFASHSSSTNWNAIGSNFYLNGINYNITINNATPISYHNLTISSGIPRLLGTSALITFNNLTWGTDVSTMNGDFNIANLTYKLSSNNIINTGSNINIANTLVANGTPCNPIILRSSSAATPATLTSSLCNFDLKYARLTGITAGSCTAAQNKVIGDDVNGNSNWAFTPIISSNYLEANVPNLNLKCNEYPYTITTAGFNAGATSILWSDGSTGADLIIYTPGTYSVTVTFGTSCTITDDITFTPLTTPEPSSASLTSCETTLGSNIGDFTLTDANALVISDPTAYTISYHESQADANANINPLATTYNSTSKTIYVRVLDISTGCFNTKEVTLNINSLPVVAQIGNTGTVSVGATRTLTNSTPDGTWSSSDPNIATINTSGLVTGVSLGTTMISYTVTSAAGCESKVNYELITNSNPVVDIITGTGTACIGQTIQLANTTRRGTWSTSNALVATVDINGLVTGVSQGNATIMYTVTEGGGSTTVSKDIVILSFPIVAPITGNSKTCIDQTIQLDNVTTNGTWSTSNAAIATVSTNGLVTGHTAGTVTISYTVTNSGGCETVVNSIITINTLPTVEPITGYNTVCIGQTAQLANATANGAWSTSNAAIATIDVNGLVTGVSKGSATINYTVTNAEGCQTVVSYLITVIEISTVAPITGNNSICTGQTTQLNNVTAGGVWSTSNAAIATVDVNGLVTSFTAGTVTIFYTVTNTGDCESSANYSVTINALPTVSAITGNNTVCIRQTSQLANATAGGTWSTSNAAIATVSTSGLVTGLTAGTVTVFYTVTNASGCDAVASYSVTINALPTVAAISGNNTVCIGQTSQLANATAGGTWSTSNAAIATVSTSGLVTGLTAGTVTVFYTVTNASGCDAVASFVISINALPTVAAITGNNTVCIGQTSQLANATPSGTWSTSSAAIATVSTSGLVTGNTAGTVTVFYTVTNASGCDAVASFVISINALPTVAATTGNNTVCIGQTSQLANATAGGTWSTSNAAIATVSTNGLVTGITAGTVTVFYTVTNASGCDAVASYSVTINALPTVAAITGLNQINITQSAQLSNSTNGGVWSSSASAVATIDAGGKVIGLTVGTTIITYTVTNTNGCTTQVSHTVNVNSSTVMNPIIGNTSLCVGEKTVLTNSTPNGVWSSSNVNIARVEENGTVTAISEGIVTISYIVTDALGSVIAKIDITVNPLPLVEPITKSGNTNSCIGNTIQLSNTTPGGTWSSSNETVAIINNSGLVTALRMGTTIISYRVTSDRGCSTVVTYELTINAFPVVEAIRGIAEICVGKTTQLYNTTSGGVWLSSNPEVATISNQGLVTGISPGNTNITYEVSGVGGCTRSVSYLITVNQLPTAKITYEHSEYQAAGIAKVIQTGQIGGSYSSSPMGLSLNVNTGEINLENSKPNQTYIITYRFSNGKCTNTTSTTLKINSIPATINYDHATYCAVGSININQTGPGGGIYTSDNNGLKVNSRTGEINLDLSIPGTYKVIYTYQDGSINANTTTIITVYALPKLTLTSNLIGELSKGDIVTLTATGGVSYSWIGEDIISGQGTNQVKVRPRTDNMYTVTAINTNGCSSKLSISLGVVNDRKIIPNNVITPNGDGKNDVWIVTNLDYYPNNKVTIYDRGGRILYSVIGYKNNWDGNYNGEPLAEGAYVYVIDSGVGIGILRGTVNIIRTQR